MLKFMTISFTLVTLLSSLAQADIEEAKELFNEAKCMKCHTPNHFKHKEDKVSNFHKLHKSVTACALNTGAGWFDDETKDVSRYLNKKYYKYEEIAEDN